MRVRFGGCGVQLGGSWRVLGGAGEHFGRLWAGFRGSWVALWGSVAPLDANMADKCDKRCKKTFCPDPNTTFLKKNVAQGRPKGAKMETKERQGTPKWKRGATIDKKRHQKLNSKYAKNVRGSFQNRLLEAWMWSQRSEKKKKKGIEKSKRGSRGKVGVQRPEDSPKIRKRIAPEGYTHSWPYSFGAQGPAVGGRGEDKSSPQEREETKTDDRFVSTGSNTPLAYGQANLANECIKQT